MPSKDVPDQDTAAAETKVSGLAGLPVRTMRHLTAWAKAHRFQAILVIGASVLFITVGVGGFLFISFSRNQPLKNLVTIDKVLESLDDRAFAETQTLARQMQLQGNLSAEELGGPAFALGAVAAYEANASPGKDRTKLFLLAARYLEEANKRGFPANRRAQGLYLLGKSLYEIGQLTACRPVLLSALKISTQYRAEIYALLADSYLNDPRPKPEQALEQNTLLLANKKLPEAKRQEGLLQRARILMCQGKIDECKAALDQIPADANNPAVAVERARVMMYKAQALGKKTPYTDDDKLKQREILQQIIDTLHIEDTDRSRAARQAMYLIGMCYLEMADYRSAVDQFVRTHNSFPYTPEGVAACFQAAEIYRRLGQDFDTLSEYRRALGGIVDPENYVNPWISLDKLKSGFLAAYQHYLSVQKFEIALQFTRIMQPLFPRDQILSLQAETHGIWGHTLLSQADKGPINKAESIRRLGREQFRSAGACYARLAKSLPANKMFTDQVWNSATAFLQGQDFDNAARMFQMYLKNEIQRRRAQALVYYGESLLAIDQLDKALEMLKECIDLYPKDVAACRARLLAARTYAEKGDWRNAQSLLLDNLNGDYLTPDAKEWRDSLFELGEMLHDEGRYAEAARRLKEAVERYPNLPETIQTRYLLAGCYHKMALDTQDKLNKDLASKSSVILANQIQELYGKALEQYKHVQEVLGQKRDNTELSAMQKAILRNCYFAIGEVLFAQEDYEAAVNAYSMAVNRYQGYPEVLNAYVQIANAYRKLNKPQEAKNALQQAKFALNRIKPDVAFDKTTNYNRKQWAERLDLLGSL